jgi:hypothetical protein
MDTVILNVAVGSNAFVSSLSSSWAFPGLLKALNVSVLLQVAWQECGILVLGPFDGLQFVLLVHVHWEWELVDSDIDDGVTLHLADPLEDDLVLVLIC